MAGKKKQQRPKIKLPQGTSNSRTRRTLAAQAANPTYKRGGMSREQILDEVSRLDLQGFRRQEIADRMGVGLAQIDRDLVEIRRRYLTNLQRDREKDLARKIAQLEQVRAQAWEAWEKSKRDRSKRTTEYVAGPPQKPGPGDKFKPGEKVTPRGRATAAAPLSSAGFQDSMRKLKTVVTVQAGTAESTYLVIVTTTLRMEAELLGLFPDMKLQLAARSEGKPSLTPAEWMMLAQPLPDAVDGVPAPAALPPRSATAEEPDPVEAEILRLEAQAAAPPQRPAKATNGKH